MWSTRSQLLHLNSPMLQKRLSFALLGFLPIRSNHFVGLTGVTCAAVLELVWVPHNVVRPLAEILPSATRSADLRFPSSKRDVPAVSVANLVENYARNERSATPEVIEVLGDQHTICLSIVTDVIRILSAVLLAVVRVLFSSWENLSHDGKCCRQPWFCGFRSGPGAYTDTAVAPSTDRS